MPKTHERETQHDSFMCGFACAVGSLAREHDQPSMAVDIMRSNGVTLQELIDAGADELDLKILRKEWQ